MKFLIIKPSALGDVVNGLAIIPGLRKLFPGVEMHWLVNSEYADLVEIFDGIDKVIKFERGAFKNPRSLLSGILNFIKLSFTLKKNNYDVVIDLQGLFRSAWFTFITRAPIRVGFSDAREQAHRFYNIKVDVKRNETHAVDCCLAVLKQLGDENPKAEWKWRDIDEIAENLCEKINFSDNDFFIFVIGSRWETKSWLPDYFGQTAAMLSNKTGKKIFLTGAKNEAVIAEKVIESAVKHGGDKNKIISLAGKVSLPELLALCKKCKLVLTTDTGPMHIAVAAGTKTIALMGPTSPVRHGPYNQQKMSIAIDNLCRLSDESIKKCAPCYKRKCPRGLNCMAEIKPEIVMEKIITLIQ